MKNYRNKFRISVAGVLLASLLLTACGDVKHPNQISQFDGDAFDTLLASRAALVQLSTRIASEYPKYAGETNTALSSFNATVSAYKSFRSGLGVTELELASQLGSVSLSIVALENQIQADLHPPAKAILDAREKVLAKRERLTSTARAHVSLASVLVQLEMFASIAQVIPATGPYGALAALVIQATSEAYLAIHNAAGKPIDLALLAPIPVISSSRQ
jgi:hypothetical protein